MRGPTRDVEHRKQKGGYYNLAAHPDRVHVEMAGRKEAVTAEELHGNERERAWKHIIITTTTPTFAKYEQKTDRQLPVIRLRPTPRSST